MIKYKYTFPEEVEAIEFTGKMWESIRDRHLGKPVKDYYDSVELKLPDIEANFTWNKYNNQLWLNSVPENIPVEVGDFICKDKSGQWIIMAPEDFKKFFQEA